MPNLDRVALSRALAKAVAFKQAGNDSKADDWAAELVRLLDCHGILVDGRQHNSTSGYAQEPLL